MITRIGSKQDIGGIIFLQKENLYDKLSAHDRKKGFVTTPFSEAQLAGLLAERGIFVAEDKGLITGYAMAGDWEFFSQWPIFPSMVSRLGSLSFAGKRTQPELSFQYGPVCITSALRGSGLLPLLFEEMRIEFAARFPVGITFINRVNERSYAAHTRKLGMTEIGAFEFSDRSYAMLAFDTSRSVIGNAGPQPRGI